MAADKNKATELPSVQDIADVIARIDFLEAEGMVIVGTHTRVMLGWACTKIAEQIHSKLLAGGQDDSNVVSFNSNE